MKPVTSAAFCALYFFGALPADAEVGMDVRPPNAPGHTVPASRPGEKLCKRPDDTNGVIRPPAI